MQLISHAQADGQARVDAPFILKKEPVMPGDAIDTRAGLRLIHIGRQTQKKIRERVTRTSRKVVVKSKNAVIVSSRKVERTRPMESFEINSTFESVAPLDPGDVVCKLVVLGV